MAVDSTFYDRNWTVLEKLKYIEQLCMENQLDVNSITFDVSTAQEVTTIVVKGMNYEGKKLPCLQLLSQVVETKYISAR